MKRLAAVAVIVAWVALTCSAQHSASHGGFSGSHGAVSGSHSGPSGHSSPSFQGGFRGVAPGRVAPPFRRVPGPSPVSGPGFRPAGPRNFSPRAPYASPRTPYTNSTHGRMPYHSPRERDGHDRDRDRDREYDRDRDRDRRGWGLYAWGGLPLWSEWGYPYLPSYFDYPDSYDSQTDSNYAATQPNADYPAGPNDDQAESQPAPSYTPWPYSAPAPPYNTQSSSSSVPETPVTLVFKDGRPPEQIHNYLLTATTLSILDQHHRDIPVDQIDLAATARANRDAGVEFSLPGGSR